MVPDEDPLPARFLRLGSQAGHNCRLGELVEQRQTQRRAQPGHARQQAACVVGPELITRHSLACASS